MSLSIQERIGSPLEKEKILTDNITSQIRVAMPGIIESFNPSSQTAVVRLAVREGVRNKESKMIEDIEFPLLLDVPVQIPRAGGYAITLPVQAGDECLVIFGDMCIDAWWESSGVQNQVERRRHDLSDGFAIVGITSQPKKLNDYPVDKLTIQAERGSSLVEIEQDSINIKSNNINLIAENVSIQATKTINISAPSEPDGNVNIVGWTAKLTELKP